MTLHSLLWGPDLLSGAEREAAHNRHDGGQTADEQEPGGDATDQGVLAGRWTTFGRYTS